MMVVNVHGTYRDLKSLFGEDLLMVRLFEEIGSVACADTFAERSQGRY